MDSNEGFEGLDFVGENRLSAMANINNCSLCGEFEVNIHLHTLPERRRVLMVPRINNAATDMFSYTIMSSSKVKNEE